MLMPAAIGQRALTFIAFASRVGPITGRLTFRDDGIFKIVHISDVHYEIGPQTPCRAVTTPCTAANSTAFIQRLLNAELPDLVVHTGDIVDWATHPSHAGMDDVYGVSIGSKLPWAATLGNHDAQSDLTRKEIMEYIVRMRGSLSQVNALGLGASEAYVSERIPTHNTPNCPRPIGLSEFGNRLPKCARIRLVLSTG